MRIYGFLFLLGMCAAGPALAADLDIRSFGAKCNGADDAAAVQNALNALNTGDTLYVPCQAGIGASGISLGSKSGVTVRGINGGGFKALAKTSSKFIFRVSGCQSCKIESLVVDGANVGVGGILFQSTAGNTALNNQISNIAYPAQAGLVAMGNTNNRYIGNSVTNTGVLYNGSQIADASRGMWIGNPSTASYEWNPYIANNRLKNIGGSGIVIHGYSAVVTGNTGEDLTWSGVKVTGGASGTGTTTIENNSFKGKVGTAYSGGGIAVAGEPNTRETIVIRNNVMEGDQESGVYISGGPFAAPINITGNTMRGNNEAGVTLVASTASMLVSGNRIEAGVRHTVQGIRLLGNSGLSMRNTTISNNVIQGTKESGILLITNGAAIDGVDIRDNKITSLPIGVYVIQNAPGIYSVGLTGNCFASVSKTVSDNRGSQALAPPPVSSSCTTTSTVDTTPPAVSLTSPANGQTVAGIVTVAANASDNVGVAGVRFTLNGSPLGTERTTAPYAVSWDTRTVANGTHRLAAIARDAAGNQTTSTAVSVTVSNATSAPAPSPAPTLTGTAAFVKTDTTTKGSWKGVYGGDGFNVIGTTPSYPSYVSVTRSGSNDFVFASTTSDTRGLQKPSPASDRIAACWYSASSFKIDLSFTDGNPHQVALYMADWDGWSGGRSQKVEILDSNGGVLDTRTVSGFWGGQYLVWNLSGRVSIRVTNTNLSSNALVNGLFFGGASAPSSGTTSGTASFVRTDTTTQGSWKNAYGAEGYHVIGTTIAYPSYVSVASSGHAGWVWASTTSESRGLQKPPPATDRIAACWYSGTSFKVDLSFNDGKAHQVAVYFVDWDRWNGGRSQRVEVVDSTGKILDTRTLSGFSAGQYLVWNLSGRVSIRVTNTNSSSNAVLGGIFFGGTPVLAANPVVTDAGF